MRPVIKIIDWLSSSPEAEEAYYLFGVLKDVLPTFAAIAKLAFDDPCRPSEERWDEEVKFIRDFYLHFHIRALSLLEALSGYDFDPSSSVEHRLATKNLSRVLNDLENSFALKNDSDRAIRRQLGFDEQMNRAYPKLRALHRILPSDGSLFPEAELASLSLIIRLHSSKPEKCTNILVALEDAVNRIVGLRPDTQSMSTCPLRFTDYPAKDLRIFSTMLFKALERSWKCQCNNHVLLNRPIKLNLTRYQRFELKSLSRRELGRNLALFQVLFPTSTGALFWKHMDVTVQTQREQTTKGEIENDLCRIIDDVGARIIPNITIFDEKLRNLRYERGAPTFLQIPDLEFKSLDYLLQAFGTEHTSRISRTDMRERTILSFILATFFFHICGANEPSLQAIMLDTNICFQVRAGQFDITKPYLNVSFFKSEGNQLVRWNDKVHPVPAILNLGIMLLETLRGTTHVPFTPGMDRCATAWVAYDKWKYDNNKGYRDRSCASAIPEGCFRAVLACLSPVQLRDGRLEGVGIGSQVTATRRYIFERVIYPLGDSLSQIYEVPLHRLDSEIPSLGVVETDSPDDTEMDSEKRKYGNLWKNYLRQTQKIFDAPRIQSLLSREQDLGTVKVAVLDTGFQLCETLQNAYKNEDRLASKECRSFCSPEHDATEWDIDTDGHGTYVGQIILSVCPRSRLYVARVCKSRKDFGTSRWAIEVQKNVAEAIKYATETWGVDMIVMSFGFERRIEIVGSAIESALKTSTPPLFFAATSNDGANREMAWPATELFVFGVSSTDGLGVFSSFNPPKNESSAILHAFGEGVEIMAPAGNLVRTATHISGTSYAAPTAAGLAAILLSFVRVAVRAYEKPDLIEYSKVPQELNKMSGMLKVLQRHMQKANETGGMSLLPWDFLKEDDVENNGILEQVTATLLYKP